jgi:hypothetical protein
MRSSNERVARALTTARANIIQLDPKRLASIRALAPTREQELAARLRQERVARTLGDVRSTVAMRIPEGWGRGLALPECS